MSVLELVAAALDPGTVARDPGAPSDGGVGADRAAVPVDSPSPETVPGGGSCATSRAISDSRQIATATITITIPRASNHRVRTPVA